MNFLARLGAILLKTTEIAVGVGPLINQAFPGQSSAVSTVTNDLSAIGQIVVQAEAFGQSLRLSGPDKLKAAIASASSVRTVPAKVPY